MKINNTQISIPSTEAHFEQMVLLQNSNIASNLSDSELSSEGFVTVVHSIDLLKEMNQDYNHVVALNNEDIVAYALVMLNKFRDNIPVLEPLFKKLDQLVYQGKALNQFRFFIMGQICIAKPFRGQGIFYRLYHAMKSQMQDHFDFVITEVSERNPRSLNAHYNAGFESLHTYTHNNVKWHIILWKWQSNQ